MAQPSASLPDDVEAGATALLRDVGHAVCTREYLDGLLLDALAAPGMAARPVREIAAMVVTGDLDRAEAALARIRATGGEPR